MEPHVKRLRIPAISLLLAALVLIPSHVTLSAGNPRGAYYSADTDKVFWFIHASDLHIGARGSTDADRLRWLVGTGRTAINPAFIVVTGDLTDSTNGNLFSYPNGPYQAEWDEYKSIVGNISPDVYYDLPGNHDAYNDRSFTYYKLNSVQGRANRGPQLSWTYDLGTQKYHFVGINSADNTGAPFSISWPWGDYAGLDGDELSYITGALTTHADADLTFLFGHHPVTDTGNADDTWLYYGHEQFVAALDVYRASTYSYGHTHNASQVLFKGDGYTGVMSGDGVHYYNVASLGKSSSDNYSIVAIDCNGVSSVTKAVGSWPVVLITAPVDKYVGSAVNPYAYTVPAASANPIRALVFDAGTLSQVRYRIDGGTTWYAMSRVAGSPALWQGTWNAASASAGSHTIEVQATGTSTVSDTITVEVAAGAPNEPPTATGDSYTTNYETGLSVAAPGVLANDTDPEHQALSAALVTGPAHGTVTLNTNGSFTYMPTTTYSGTDSFTYKASDGALESAVATVTITVRSASTADTVTILSATYNAKRKQLSVTATSSAQPNATLTVEGYGTMTYKARTKTYVLTASAPTKPATVTVTSSRGGTATAIVN